MIPLLANLLNTNLTKAWTSATRDFQHTNPPYTVYAIALSS